MGKRGKGGRVATSIQLIKRGQEARKKKAASVIEKKKGSNIVKKKEQKPQQHAPLIPFKKTDKILLIGEGDFSYATSLIIDHEMNGSQVTATCYDDSIQELNNKYSQEVIEKNLNILNQHNVQVFYSIDATKLSKNKKKFKNRAPYDIVMFHFPHKGNSVSSVDHNIRQHQILINEFFKSVVDQSIIHSNSRIVVSLFQGPPYDEWNIKGLAKHQPTSLVVERSGSFEWNLFPSYNHRLTSGGKGDTNKPYKTRKARTYIFKLAVAAGSYKGKNEKQNSKKNNSSSSDDDDDD